MSGATRYRFNDQEADRVVALYERVLRHTKGLYARMPFILTDWQRDDIIRPLYGWQRFDEQWQLWVRKYSTAYIELGRGNGKSELAAGAALEGLIADGEEGAEVYGAAEDKEQASIIWGVVERMIALSPALSRMKDRKDLHILKSRKRIVYEPTGSFYQVLPRDEMGEGSQGFNPSTVVFDEYHVQKTADLKNALRKGMGKGRRQPLFFIITTAGNNPTSPCAEEHEYSEKVAAGEVDDPSRFVYIRNTPKDADPWIEKNWYFANPGLGDFLSIETLREEAREAKEKPADENDFRQYRLNQWVNQQTRWMPLVRWDSTASIVKKDKLKGRRCYAGIRVAAPTDVAALALDFPDGDKHQALYRFFVPEGRLKDLHKRTHGQAAVWRKRKILQVTPGDVIDYEAVLTQIDKDAQLYDIEELVHDRWGATQLVQKLEELGMTTTQFGQGFTSMGPPMAEWERLIYAELYHHGGNPMMRWMVDNIVVAKDAAGNLKIDLKNSKDTVVGPVAAVMALDRAIRDEGGGLGDVVIYEEGDEDLLEGDDEANISM